MEQSIFQYKHLNFAHLQSYFKDNMDKMGDLFRMFIKSTTEDEKQLNLNLEKGDYENLRVCAHRLKSAYKYLGLFEVGKILQEVEDSAKEKLPITLIESKLKAVFLLQAEILEEMKNYLNR
mgnify:CR=1 FL=1